MFISSRTLTVANQAEVPFLHYVTLTSNTTIENGSRQFIIPIAAADINYNTLGAPFSEEHIHIINIQGITIQFEHPSKVHPNYTKITSPFSKDYPCFPTYTKSTLEHKYV